jgi:GTP-binding protein LepA
MKLAEARRCRLLKTDYLSPTRVMLEYKAPLAEIVYDFYDLIKGISHGYATMDYEFTGFEPGDLVKIDILVNGTPVEALSLIVHRSNAEPRGRKLITSSARPSRDTSSRSRSRSPSAARSSPARRSRPTART